MKKYVLAISLLSAVTFVNAQETTKNAENSNYVLTKMYHLDATPVLSQGYTGTCWSFSALSFFESELIRKGRKNPPLLSQMYVVRKAYEAKAEKYIRLDGKGNFSEGGAFHDIPYVIKHYGIVPNSVYGGLNYGEEEHDHSEMYAVLNGAVMGVAGHLKELNGSSLSNAWKKAVAGVLDAYLGADPTQFDYEGKKYTPKSFAESLNLNMDDYVSITSLNSEELYSEYQLAIPDNWA